MQEHSGGSSLGRSVSEMDGDECELNRLTRAAHLPPLQLTQRRIALGSIGYEIHASERVVRQYGNHFSWVVRVQDRIATRILLLDFPLCFGR